MLRGIVTTQKGRPEINRVRFSSVEHNGASLPLRSEGGGEEGVAGMGLFGCDAAQGLLHIAAVDEFVTEGGPHLEDGIGEAELEDGTGNGGVRGLVGHVEDAPLLLAAGRVGHIGQLLGILCAELGGEGGSVDA